MKARKSKESGFTAHSTVPPVPGVTILSAEGIVRRLLGAMQDLEMVVLSIKEQSPTAQSFWLKEGDSSLMILVEPCEKISIKASYISTLERQAKPMKK